ncbi:hydroxymethylpyrimidine/phosphomethylpyrimidine kinase [Luteibacter sp. Sphag1AF]|uniref:bifunctional hydroxymethylpyrimidine kinase/phosphomethylpyrimidine kinase n=1 Tax=Luteibacter sp. Sphag1AF TaxID=2587031 RepID=UPI001608644A|nr:bifunctional hydroxymethylpyrimidine kinase/phosphomethylpyrimidine kinase [Luteibacter sp. Sphag1AF]MBB3228737.1 hydroxymethylpyrimidine/phosphomethylpyrimidine kinase [Luteibacter sp. Sphag1AF]
MTRATALTIAGSDSGGGAGIQADLKTMHALGVHGLSVITAITSQNTRGVTAVHAVPLTHIRSQLAAVFDDFSMGAVKTGMLGSAAVTRLVAREMRHRQPAWLVVDPVMIASSGTRLLAEDAIAATVSALIPLAHILTPNLPEAEVLVGAPIRTADDCHAAAAALRAMGAGAVLMKGGHAEGTTVVDRLYDEHGVMEISHPRIDREGHGTGCTLASAVAAELARGNMPRDAVRHAISYVQRAFAASYQPGGGAVYVLGH